MKTLKILSFMLMFSVLVVSCGGAEEVKGDAKKVEQAANNASKKVEGAVDDATKKVDEAVDDATKKVEEVTDDHSGHGH